MAPRSAADQAGLQAGQVILSVNQAGTTSVKALKRAMKAAGDTILLRVRMSQGVRFVVLSK